MISQLQSPNDSSNPLVLPLKLFNKKNVLNNEMCNTIKEFSLSENSGWRRSTDHNPKNSGWIRCSSCRLPLQWNNNKLHDILSPIWEEAFNYYEFDVTHVEQYEIKRYGEGDYSTAHVDQFFGKAGNERKLTMLVQLSNEAEYSGGNLHVLKDSKDKSIGSVIIFPSFYIHEVKPVITGERWSMASWAWGPYWK